MRRSVSIAACVLAAICGCARETPPPPAPVARTDVSLTVLVVDEPEIARAIGRLRGDWAELSGGSLAVEEVPRDEFSAGEPIAADVVIYPARYLGALVEEERVRPLRASVREEEELAFHEILPAIRDGELAYGGEHYAVPFGSHLLTVVAAEDGSATAATAEIEKPAKDDAADGNRPAADRHDLPSDPFAAAFVLLAHAAPKAKHPSQLGVLFDLESMKPRIDGPAFVTSLTELTAAATGGEGGESAQRPVWRWWPPAVGAPGGDRPRDVRGALPESERIYYADGDTWEQPAGGVSRTPLVGGRSFIGSVTSSSRNAPAAFRLLGWLAGRSGGGGGRVSVAPYRRGIADDLIARTLSQSSFLHVPRILEVDSYLSALDEGVRRAWNGEVSPQEALDETAKKWDKFTDRVGRERQQAVYRKHLNLP